MKYPTDLSDNQWQYIKKTMNLKERKRKYPLLLIWNSLMYLIKTGCQWRMLPKDFPKWQLVYYYYIRWTELGYFDLILEKLRMKVRIKKGQRAEASLGIMDSQSVRWGNNRGLHGVDGNKKIKGIKRHVLVDKNGFLIAVMVCVANIHDSKAGLLLLRLLREELMNFMCILADAGYRGDFLDKAHSLYSYLVKVVSRDKEKQAKKEFKPVSKRWVIERTFAWFDNDRRLCRNYELLHESSENMTKLSAIKLLLNKI